MPLAWTSLVAVGITNLGSKKEFLSGFMGRRQEGSKKEKGKSRHTGTRGANLVTVHVRYLGTPRLHGDG